MRYCCNIDRCDEEKEPQTAEDFCPICNGLSTGVGSSRAMAAAQISESQTGVEKYGYNVGLFVLWRFTCLYCVVEGCGGDCNYFLEWMTHCDSFFGRKIYPPKLEKFCFEVGN